MKAGDKVKSSNPHTIKCLEFSHVAICGVNQVSTGSDKEDDEIGRRRLLYVGMTRATDELFMMISGTGPIGSDLLRSA